MTLASKSCTLKTLMPVLDEFHIPELFSLLQIMPVIDDREL